MNEKIRALETQLAFLERRMNKQFEEWDGDAAPFNEEFRAEEQKRLFRMVDDIRKCLQRLRLRQQ